MRMSNEILNGSAGARDAAEGVDPVVLEHDAVAERLMSAEHEP